MSNEWLKIKIVRDIKKITISGNNKHQQIKNFSPSYLNLLSLIRNKWFYNNDGIPNRKISTKDLDKMNLKFLEEISKFENVTVVNSHIFEISIIEENNLFTRACVVGDIVCDTLEHIKYNQNYMFYIYQIDERYARWYRRYEKNLIKNRRKKKLNKIEQL
jgi:hypothetical protein